MTTDNECEHEWLFFESFMKDSNTAGHRFYCDKCEKSKIEYERLDEDVL